MKISIYIFLLLGFMSFNKINFSDPEYPTIHLSDRNYKYTIQIINKEINIVQPDKMYYWYKAQEIHNSIGQYDGKLLHGKFTKSYKSNQLAERGFFKKGLKIDYWTNWYENGNIKQNVFWKSGVKNGIYEEFNIKGEKVLSGNYSDNLKSGMWIDYTKSDTLYYRKGKILKDKPLSLSTKVSIFFKKIFSNNNMKKKGKNKRKSNNRKTSKKNKN